MTASRRTPNFSPMVLPLTTAACRSSSSDSFLASSCRFISNSSDFCLNNFSSSVSAGTELSFVVARASASNCVSKARIIEAFASRYASSALMLRTSTNVSSFAGLSTTATALPMTIIDWLSSSKPASSGCISPSAPFFSIFPSFSITSVSASLKSFLASDLFSVPMYFSCSVPISFWAS